MNDTKRNPDPSNSEDAYERGARGSASVNGEDDQAPTEQAPVTEQGDGSGAPDTGSDVAELSTRDDWQRKVDEQRDKYLRLAAEYDNFRKRAASERPGGRVARAGRAGAAAHRRARRPRALRARRSGDDRRGDGRAGRRHGREEAAEVARRGRARGDQSAWTSPSIRRCTRLSPPSRRSAREDDHMVARVYPAAATCSSGQLLRPARVVVKQWNG